MNAVNYLRWARFTWWNYKLFARRLAEVARNVKSILDVGCGNGLLLDELKIFFPDALIVGIDSSKEMLTVRKQANYILIGKAEHLPFKDGSFDVVTCMYSLHEFDILAAIEEIYRVLKDDGLLSIKEINCNAPVWALSYLKLLLSMFFDKKTVEGHIKLYQTFKSPKKLKLILEKNGFRVVRTDESLLDFIVFCVKS